MTRDEVEAGEDQGLIREFRDVPMYAQLGMGVVGALGLCATLSLFSSRLLPLAAGALGATALALGVVYFLWCRPERLSQTSDGITIRQGKREKTIAFDELSEFAVSWTDIHRNGVYQNTLVRFEFAETNSTKRWRYKSCAMYDTVKFEELQAFQGEVSGALVQRLLAELQEQGRVLWTKRLTLLADGIEFKKNPTAGIRVLNYPQITRCEVDQGLLKLAVDGSEKPNIVEKTNQANFYPGLFLFEQLMGSSTSAPSLDADVHAMGI